MERLKVLGIAAAALTLYACDARASSVQQFLSTPTLNPSAETEIFTPATIPTKIVPIIPSETPVSTNRFLFIPPIPEVPPYTGEKLMQDDPELFVKSCRVVEIEQANNLATGIMDWPVYGDIWNLYGYPFPTHLGIDISRKTGIPIKAADGGIVTIAEKLDVGYGWFIAIYHGELDGVPTWTQYAHLSKFEVSEGDLVQKNQEIGLMGSTGHSSGPHLHFEVWQGKSCNQVNPLKFLS